MKKALSILFILIIAFTSCNCPHCNYEAKPRKDATWTYTIQVKYLDHSIDTLVITSCFEPHLYVSEGRYGKLSVGMYDYASNVKTFKILKTKFNGE